MRGSATPRSLTALAALLFGAAGCTICPDPFDYCGPVPDGSAPQNDFRVRANGIAPLGSHPVPWPPVVQAAPRSDADSRHAIADADAEPIADDGADAGPEDVPSDVQPVAAEEPDEADGATEAAGVEVPQPVDEEPDVIAVPDEPPLDVILPPTAPPRPEILPRLRESRGWKPRG